ncbi:MAG TPA: hypothetical protein VJA21_12220 [Verrucomicrobiae bacterium]
MKPKLLAVLVVLVVLPSIPFVPGIISRHSSPPITARYINNRREGNRILVSLNVTNHSTRTYATGMKSLEFRNGTNWETLCQFRVLDGFCHLRPHGSELCDFDLTNFPTATTLRLKIWVAKRAKGPEEFFLKLETCLKNRTLYFYKNPTETFSNRRDEIISEEFSL